MPAWIRSQSHKKTDPFSLTHNLMNWENYTDNESDDDYETLCKHRLHNECFKNGGNTTCTYCATMIISSSEGLEKILREQDYSYITSLTEEEKKEILIYSIAERNMELFNLLVERLKNINYQGWNLISQACIARNTEALDTLKRLGADVNERDKNGNCPIHFACYNGFVDIVEKLIKLGADIMCKDRYGKSSLHEAILIVRTH
jgi:hypothetical protein